MYRIPVGHYSATRHPRKQQHQQQQQHTIISSNTLLRPGCPAPARADAALAWRSWAHHRIQLAGRMGLVELEVASLYPDPVALVVGEWVGWGW